MSDESRSQFEQEAANTLGLPVQMIVDARKGDGYDHAYNSMNVMQPLNDWWHWWKKSRASLVVEQWDFDTFSPNDCGDEAVWMTEVKRTLGKAGITVKGERDE